MLFRARFFLYLPLSFTKPLTLALPSFFFFLFIFLLVHRLHRDLKYENILFENSKPMANIKVIDFGLSKKFKTGVPGIMTERVGTMYVDRCCCFYCGDLSF